MSQELDLVVLGGGTGGYVAAIRASQLGMKVAVVEKDVLGGTCLHRGCIPSKALLRSAEVFATAKVAADFGVIHDAPRFDLNRAMDRKNRVVSQLHKGVEFLMKKHHIEVYHGTGRLMGPSIFSPTAGAVSVTPDVGEPVLLSPRFTLVATGSRPRALEELPFDGQRVLSSDDIVRLEVLPKDIIVVGGGAIGVEWASMLNDVGVNVTIVEAMNQLLPSEDEDVGAELLRVFKKRGIRVLLSATLLTSTYEANPDGVQITVREAGGADVALTADAVLVSVGREPVIEDIGLGATEVVINRGAIEVDKDYRTAETSIFAIGDVIGGLQLAHVAAHEGIHAVEVMAGLHPSPMNSTLVPKCTYARPEVASVGLTEKAAKAAGMVVKVGKFPFRAVGKALVYGEVDGWVKVVADANTEDILGVHMVGPHVTDLISEAGLALVLNAVPWEIAHTIHPHPTLPEALAEAALAVDGLAIHG